MKCAAQKLHSRRGVSILLAMVLMLVVTMISVVIVSAAVTAASRVGDDRDQQQDFLTASSAGKLITQFLEENKLYSKTVERWEYTDGSASRNKDNPGEGSLEYLEKLVNNLSDDSTYTVTVTPANSQMKPAVLTYTVKSAGQVDGNQKYNLTGILQLTGGGQKLYFSTSLYKKVVEEVESNEIMEWKEDEDGHGGYVGTGVYEIYTKTVTSWTLYQPSNTIPDSSQHVKVNLSTVSPATAGGSDG